MNTIEDHRPMLPYDLEELTEICKLAGAATSTVIDSTDKVVVFYRDPQTQGIQDANLFDELHIQHRKNAQLLIAVFPTENQHG